MLEARRRSVRPCPPKKRERCGKRPVRPPFPPIPCISFHFWQRIETYQRVGDDSRGKILFGPLPPAGRRALHSDGSRTAAAAGRAASTEPDKRRSPSGRGTGTNMEHDFKLVKRNVCRVGTWTPFPLKSQLHSWASRPSR